MSLISEGAAVATGTWFERFEVLAGEVAFQLAGDQRVTR